MKKIKLVGSAGEYKVWGVDWYHEKVLILISGYPEWKDFRRLTKESREFIESKYLKS